MSHVLILDDQEDICLMLSEILEENGYSVVYAKDSKTALRLAAKHRPRVILLDIWLGTGHMDGIGVLKIVKNLYPNTHTIMLSGNSNIGVAVQAIKHGAYDFIEKPFKTSKVLLTIQRAIEASNMKLSTYIDNLPYNIIGNTKKINRVKGAIEEIAKSGSRVAIIGEIGSGRKLASKLIHLRSRNRFLPYMEIYILPSHNHKEIEEMLFGSNDKISRLEEGGGGICVIGGMHNIPSDLQSRFCKMLSLMHVPDTDNKSKLDTRIISVFENNIESMTKNKEFSNDLFKRLSTTKIYIPTLRERKSDIPMIAKHFLKQVANQIDHELAIEDDAMQLLQDYDWPLNVKQLLNTLEDAAIQSKIKQSKILSKELLSNSIKNHYDIETKIFKSSVWHEIMNKPIKEARNFMELLYIQKQLKKFDGNIAKAAKYIGMDRTALHRKINTLNAKK